AARLPDGRRRSGDGDAARAPGRTRIRGRRRPRRIRERRRRCERRCTREGCRRRRERRRCTRERRHRCGERRGDFRRRRGNGRRTAMSRPADLPGITLAPEVFDSSRLSRLGTLFLTLPVWIQALAVYFVSRVVSISIFAAVLKRQDPANWSSSPVTTTLNDFLNFWDSGWYARVAE